MPSKRDPEKKHVGLWVSPDELKDMDELAVQLNLTRTDLIKTLVSNQWNLLHLRTRARQKTAN